MFPHENISKQTGVFNRWILLIKINIHCPLSIFLYQKITVYIGGSAHFRSVCNFRFQRTTFDRNSIQPQLNYIFSPHLCSQLLQGHDSNGWYMCKASHVITIGKYLKMKLSSLLDQSNDKKCLPLIMYVFYNPRSIKLFRCGTFNSHPKKSTHDQLSAVKLNISLCNKLVVKLLTLIDYCFHFTNMSNLTQFSPSLAELLILEKKKCLHVYKQQCGFPSKE